MAASKSDIRKAALARRDAQACAALSARACAHLVDHVRRIPTLEIVAGYMPIRSEVDPRAGLEAPADEGFALCLPVVNGRGEPLRFREWRPGAELDEGTYGAKVPASGEWVEPELLITPLVAFDAFGQRLGYGGGFYDRTLSQLRAMRRTYAIGLAFACQTVEKLPAEPTDQPLDAVVTEEGVRYPL